MDSHKRGWEEEKKKREEEEARCELERLKKRVAELEERLGISAKEESPRGLKFEVCEQDLEERSLMK